jgi:DNA-directed RNA polymerase subunit F
MITERQSLSMAEAGEFIKESESAAELKKFMKKFIKLNAKKAKELREKLDALDLMKIKSENISKIIDLLPDNADDLNKIFVDVSLDENEIQRILDTIKEFTK